MQWNQYCIELCGMLHVQHAVTALQPTFNAVTPDVPSTVQIAVGIRGCATHCHSSVAHTPTSQAINVLTGSSGCKEAAGSPCAPISEVVKQVQYVNSMHAVSKCACVHVYVNPSFKNIASRRHTGEETVSVFIKSQNRDREIQRVFDQLKVDQNTTCNEIVDGIVAQQIYTL
jgi:hypothetical protein